MKKRFTVYPKNYVRASGAYKASTDISTGTSIADVKVGDIVICYDEYGHDYVEHEFRVDSIEHEPAYATEEDPTGTILYGTDLGYVDENGEFDEGDDEYIGSVHAGNFVGIKR